MNFRFLFRVSVLACAMFFGLLRGDAVAAAPALDATLNPKFISTEAGEGLVTIMATARQPDGKLIVAGQFTSINGVARRNIARLNVDGSVDAGFNPSPNNFVRGVLVQADGKVVFFGFFTVVQPGGTGQNISRSGLARVNADGSLENYNLGLDDAVYSAALQADGKLLLAGQFGTVLGSPRKGMARINTDGTLDAGFNPNSDSGAWCVAVQPDGMILYGGFFTKLGGTIARSRIGRVDAAGNVDMSFDPSANDDVESLTVQADGKILAGGRFSSFSPNAAMTPIPRQGFARLNADGTVDSSFRADVTGEPGYAIRVLCSAVQADGKFFAAGNFSKYWPGTVNVGTPLLRNGLLRFDASGAFDSEYNAGLNESAYGVRFQDDGNIVVNGAFSKVVGATRLGVARLKNDAATQSLVVTGTTKVEWLRSGSAPLVSWATFEQSIDNGATWTALGNGTKVGATANWELTGLSLPTAVALRVRGAAPGGGGNSGSSSIIEQVALAPTVTTGVATLITADSATLPGTVSANNFATQVSFEYSTDPTLSTGVVTVPAQPQPAGAKNIALSEAITGLAGHTTYYFRITATNTGGVSNGAIGTFTTLNTAPYAVDDAVLIEKTNTAPVTIDALANDLDADGDTPGILIVGKPKKGTATISGSGAASRIIYTPLAGYATAGADSFTYEIIDGFGGTAKAKVIISSSDFAMRAGQFIGQLTGAGNSIRGTVTLVLTKTGTFTATVIVDGVKKTVKGAFDTNGDFTSTDGLSIFHIDLTADSGAPGSFDLTGTVAPDSTTIPYTLSASHAAYLPGTKPVEMGNYTVFLEHPGSTPAGTAWATMSVANGGSVKVNGKLSDGTTLSFSTVLVGGSGAENEAHLSAVLAYPIKGSLTGEIVFDETQPDSDCAGTLRWIKPVQTKGSLYPGGFDVTNLGFSASRYTPPAKGTAALTFPNTSPNGTIALTDGDLAAPISKNLTLSTANKITITDANAEKVAITITASKGTFTGSFFTIFPPATKAVKVPFTGILYQKTTRAAGYFLSPTTSGGVEILPAP